MYRQNGGCNPIQVSKESKNKKYECSERCFKGRTRSTREKKKKGGGGSAKEAKA
jgi:hypothetical protein